MSDKDQQTLGSSSRGQAPHPASQVPASQVVERLRARTRPADRYESKGEIARGGMGAIHRVFDQDLRRTLAMKVMLDVEAQAGESASQLSATSRRCARFLEEAQITGQLDHPGIVPVHEMGLDDQGRLFFTMKLVKGRDLREILELLREGKEGWNLTRALNVLLRVCEAMAFAHEKGVIHRDLKPANIMVGRFGEVYVMDWGLAKVLGRPDPHDVRLAVPDASRSIVRTERKEMADVEPDSSLATMDGDVVGTPCYMAPEQAKGRLEDIGPHSDVYSLGSMLYQVLSGQMPYVPPNEKVSPHTVLGLLIQAPPKPLAEIARNVPDELVAICEKAMARDVRERYPSMLGVAEDLRAFLEGRVVKAHETGAVAEFKKWIARNRGFATAVAAAIVAVLALSGAIAGSR
jgi:serine/threonine protein kinase